MFDRLAEYENGFVFESFVDFCDYLQTHSTFKAICRFPSFEDYELGLQAVYIKTNIFLVLEEITVFANERYISPGLDSIIRFGRHKQVHLLAITQRCANVPKLLTSQMDMLICYKQTEPRDLQYLSQVVGERAFDLPELDEYEYMYFEP